MTLPDAVTVWNACSHALCSDGVGVGGLWSFRTVFWLGTASWGLVLASTFSTSAFGSIETSSAAIAWLAIVSLEGLVAGEIDHGSDDRRVWTVEKLLLGEKERSIGTRSLSITARSSGSCCAILRAVVKSVVVVPNAGPSCAETTFAPTEGSGSMLDSMLFAFGPGLFTNVHLRPIVSPLIPMVSVLHARLCEEDGS
jgi:hypothetical protein